MCWGARFLMKKSWGGCAFLGQREKSCESKCSPI